MADNQSGKPTAAQREAADPTLQSQFPPRDASSTPRSGETRHSFGGRNHQRPSGLPALKMGTQLCQGRFEVRGRLGQGGMGIVYEAMDQKRNALVALKMLANTGPEEIYRLKKEFRLLRGMRHPNLALFYDLFGEEDRWFFTMELVDGLPFDRWLTQSPRDALKLRAVFHQLALGLQAVHLAGKLHRDIKPSNVIVTSGGRPVILDFGIGLELGSSDSLETGPGSWLRGTPAYMAPEQILQGKPGPESDWYAFGVMLYLSVAGQLPFGDRDVLAKKLTGEPPRVLEVVSEAPVDLADLADALLCREPAARPPVEEILRRLDPGPSTYPTAAVSGLTRMTILGRSAELEVLRSAWESSQNQTPCICLIRGESGMGKTALVDAFLDDLASRNSSVILRGRCHDRESVPYKAFDGLVDDLSRYLCRLPRDRASAVIPRDVFAAAELFPVLERVDVIAEAPKRFIPDPHERKRRGVVALAEMLSRIADRGSLVLFIDDLQWTDDDSALLLHDLIEQPDPPSVLLIGAFRAEHEGENGALKRLGDTMMRSSAIAHREITLGPLSPEVCTQLAATICGKQTPLALLRITQESGGSPLFVHELSLFWAKEAALARGLPSLDVLLFERIGRLNSSARELLEAVAISFTPLNVELFERVQPGDLEIAGSVDLLVDQQLVRAVPRADGLVLECYHDKIRECVVRGMSASIAESTHGLLAKIGELVEKPDADALAVHFAKAGNISQAAHFSAIAARNAMTQLAFELAVTRATFCIESNELGETEHHELLVLRGHALSALGRGPEAADDYLSAGEGSEDDLGIEMRRLAAQHLLMAGHMSRGTQLLEEVLETLRLPKTAGSVVWQRVATRLRGTHFKERPEPTLRPGELSRVDASWTSSICFSLTDNIRGASYQAHHLRQALRLGEPFRVARALILEYGYQGRLGLRQAHHAERLRKQVLDLAERLDHPRLLGMLKAGDASAQYCQGRLLESVQSANEALQLLEGEMEDAYYFQTVALFFRLQSQFLLGRLKEVRTSLHALLSTAKRKGNLFMEVTLGAGWSRAAAQLSKGHVEAYRTMSTVHRARWVKHPFLMQHGLMLVGDAMESIYLGHAHTAHRRLVEQWETYLRSELQRIPAMHATMLFARGNTAASFSRRASAAGEQRQLVKDMADCARGLELVERDFPSLVTTRFLLGAASSACQRDPGRQKRSLELAVGASETHGLRAFGAAARHRLGQLIGGDEGRALIGQARSFFDAEEVADIEQTVEMLAPGCRADS